MFVFYMVYLIRNIKNNMLNRVKLIFSKYHFDLFDNSINVAASYISLRIFCNIYDLDEKLQGNPFKAAELTEKHTQEITSKMSHLL